MLTKIARIPTVYKYTSYRYKYMNLQDLLQNNNKTGFLVRANEEGDRDIKRREDFLKLFRN